MYFSACSQRENTVCNSLFYYAVLFPESSYHNCHELMICFVTCSVFTSLSVFPVHSLVPGTHTQEICIEQMNKSMNNYNPATSSHVHQSQLFLSSSFYPAEMGATYGIFTQRPSLAIHHGSFLFTSGFTCLLCLKGISVCYTGDFLLRM